MGPALVNGAPGVVLAPGGRLSRALRFRLSRGRIVEVEVIVHPAHLAELDLAVLDG
jgi:RNA polymerase sigma-70 factor (ECF subfamily)